MNKLFLLFFLLFFTVNASTYSNENSTRVGLQLSPQEQEFIRKHPIVRFSDVQWEPFSNINGKNYSGIFRDYYDEIEKISGLKFQYIAPGDGVDFKQVLNALKEKQIDMIDGSGKTDNRMQYALFAGPFMQVSLGIASNRDQRYGSLQSLTSKKVAIASGSTALEFVKQNCPDIQVTQTQSPGEGMNLLAHHDVEAVIDNLVVLDYAIQKNGSSNLQVTQVDDYDFKIYALIRNDYPLLQSIIQKSIDAIRSKRDIEIKNTIIKESLYRTPKQIPLSITEQYYLKQKKEITMCVDPLWEPFEKIDENGKYQGIAADLIGLATERTGINIKLLKTSGWEESLRLSKTKKCDILSFLNQTPDRDKWLIFTDTLLKDPNVIITRSNHPYILSLKEIHNETVALPEGTMVSERIRRDYPSLKIINVNSEQEAIRMVANKKADMTIRSLIVAAYTIRKEGLFDLKIAGQLDAYANDLRMGVLSSDHVLKDILNKGIQSITEQEREAIINKHTAIVINKESDGKTLKIVLIVVFVLLVIVGLVLLLNRLLRQKIKQEVAKNLLIKDQLYQKSKQAEIGNLMASISHQWREPLSKLSSINLLTIVKIKMGHTIDTEWLLQQAQTTEDTIEFMSTTMQDFLDFYKQSSIKSDFSTYQSIESSLSIIKTKILDLGIHILITGEDIVLNGVKNEWMQIWLNLLNNSIQIFSDQKISNPTIRIKLNVNSVSFCDNGGGMDTSIEYSGLGHQMCQEIANKYGARLELNNTDGGLCATVILRSVCDINTQ